MMHETCHDSLELREEIADAAKHFESTLPESVKADIANANSDLYYGPIYHNADGERCTFCDVGAKAFDFSAACDRIRNALEDVSDLRIEVAYDDETEESIYESLQDSAEEIRKLIVGKELYSYVR